MGKTIAIIPAVYYSVGLRGKVLKKLGDKSILQHIYDNIKLAEKIDEIIIATDDQRIVDEANAFGAQAEMTFPAHKWDTDRCAQVGRQFWDDDIIINVGSCYPFVNPKIVNLLATKMQEDNWIELATLYTLEQSEEQYLNENVVKLVTDKNDKVLYFSRATIPFFKKNDEQKISFKKHVEIYAYRNKILQSITSLDGSYLQNAEKLEQLRWLEDGYKIHAFEIDFKGFRIDTEEDLQNANIMLKNKSV